MSLTALAWCVLMLVLSVLALTRPIWGIATYILMLFANPNNWWWGKGTLEGFGHWTLTAGVVMLGSAVIGYRPQAKDGAPDVEPGVFRFLMVLYVANLVFVTFVFAADLNASMAILILQLKFLLLIICLDAAIRNEADFELFLMCLVFGLGYLGYEATINDRGRMKQGRLEGIFVAGDSDSNSIGALIALHLPVFGAIVLTWTGWKRVVAFFATPMALNLLLMGASRACLLASIISGCLMAVLARGRERKLVLLGMVLGALGLVVLLRDQGIIDRFMTTFAEEEQRDKSAESRLLFWGRGLRCLLDHPMGVGGDGFKKRFAAVYMPDLMTGSARAVHNGHLNEALQWGVQGYIFRAGLYLVALVALRHGQVIYGRLGNQRWSFVGVGLIAGIVAFCMATFFSDYWDSEWGLWMCVLAFPYLRNARAAESRVRAAPVAPSIPDEVAHRARVPVAGAWSI